MRGAWSQLGRDLELSGEGDSLDGLGDAEHGGIRTRLLDGDGNQAARLVRLPVQWGLTPLALGRRRSGRGGRSCWEGTVEKVGLHIQVEAPILRGRIRGAEGGLDGEGKVLGGRIDGDDP